MFHTFQPRYGSTVSDPPPHRPSNAEKAHPASVWTAVNKPVNIIFTHKRFCLWLAKFIIGYIFSCCLFNQKLRFFNYNLYYNYKLKSVFTIHKRPTEWYVFLYRKLAGSGAVVVTDSCWTVWISKLNFQAHQVIVLSSAPLKSSELLWIETSRIWGCSAVCPDSLKS